MVCGCINSVFVGWRDVALERTRNKRALQEFKNNVGANLVNDAIPRKDQFALCHKITLTLNEWLLDMTDWLINLLIESVNYWLVIWRNVWQAGWFPTNWLIDQSSRPSDWLNDQLTDRLTYGQTDWLTDVLTDRPTRLCKLRFQWLTSHSLSLVFLILFRIYQPYRMLACSF